MRALIVVGRRLTTQLWQLRVLRLRVFLGSVLGERRRSGQRQYCGWDIRRLLDEFSARFIALVHSQSFPHSRTTELQSGTIVPELHNVTINVKSI